MLPSVLSLDCEPFGTTRNWLIAYRLNCAMRDFAGFFFRRFEITVGEFDQHTLVTMRS